MMAFILAILKILGIVLLILLCLLLLVIALVLFVPIRYRIDVTHADEISVRVRVTWLLHLVKVRFFKDTDHQLFDLRILGFRVVDFLHKKERPKKKTSNRARRERTSERKRMKKAKIKQPETMQSNKNQSEVNQSERNRQDVTNSNFNNFEADNSDVINLEKKHSEVKASETNQLQMKQPEIKSVQVNQTEGEPKVETKLLEEDVTAEENEGIFGKLMQKFLRLKKNIIDFVHNFTTKVRSFWQTMLTLFHKSSLVIDFISNEENKASFSYFYFVLKKILKHVGPTKMESSILFGTGDPCSTGQALGVISIVRAATGYHITITPDFENEVLEGEHSLKGRIIPIALLIIGLKLLFDERTKNLKKNYEILKEAL